MIRRTPEAILTAYRMDPARRELYVEGRRDRLFFDWLMGTLSVTKACVREIAAVELACVSNGGERARLLAFAGQIGQAPIALMCFADADSDRLLSRPVPQRVWLTDGRDLEGYVLHPTCIEKVL